MRAFVCTPGFEDALAAELAPRFSVQRVSVAGVVLAHDRAPPTGGPSDGDVDPVFARQVLPDAREVSGSSVRELAEASYTLVAPAVDGQPQQDPRPFTLHAFPHAGGALVIAPVAQGDVGALQLEPGLGSRVELIGREVLALLQQRRRRAFRHYVPAAGVPPDGPFETTLLQLLALDRNRLLVSAAAPRSLAGGGTDLAPWPAGTAPIPTDRAPPSRAYQKLEEAFRWIGAAPGRGQLCVDLGAAPGGWTLTALRRGARVVAVDRSPVEAPASGDARLTMTIGNAFTYAPAQPVDWLLCDVVCEPPRTLALIDRWLTNRWCRNLICTVKFKGREQYNLLSALPALFAPRLASGQLRFARTKQLAHNKNEVTVMARG